MGGFYSFVTAFCSVSLLIGGLYLLCPEGAIAKSVRYVFCLVFILSVCTAAFSLKDISVSYSAQPSGSDTNAEMQTAAARYTIEYALKAEKINFSKITVCTDKSEDGSIIITKVIIYSDTGREEIISALGGAQNYEVEVVNE